MKRFKRQDILKGITRGGVLVGIAGFCAVLANREEKPDCSIRCGECPKFSNGNCSLGLK
jgi:hypothetical protein